MQKPTMVGQTFSCALGTRLITRLTTGIQDIVMVK